MEHNCHICNKMYSSYQSLWIHNKKYHSTKKHNNPQNSTSNPQNSTSNPPKSTNNLSCKYCDKLFSRSDSLNRHFNSCKKKKEQENNLKDNLEDTIKKIIKSELKHNTKPTTNIKVHGTLINGNNTDSGPKLTIYKTGTESMDQITYNEVSTIFDNEISSVIKLIELVNFSDNKPQNHSFCSTALESPYLSFYNTDTNSVNKERKKYFFEDVICKSIQNHEILYSKFKNKFNSVKRKQIEDNISNLKKMKENSFNSKIMGEMIRNLNLLSYNKRDLIQETWNGKKYDNDSDEEFMAMLLDDPQTQAIIEANKNSNDNSESDVNTESSSDSDSERPEILPKYIKTNYKKSKTNLIV